MDENIQIWIRTCLDRGICPQCQMPIAQYKGVGSGKLDEGLFCSLDCFGRFYKKDLEKKRGTATRFSNN